MEAPAPVASSERIAVLDVLRGFALYGVLLANTVVWFNGLAFLPREATAAREDSIDAAAGFLLGIFVHGKAMALLTFLFGVGFSMQLERAEARGHSVVPLHLRRMAAMGGIGLCHVALLWLGDILWGYALAGVALVLFRKAKPRTLFAWAVALSLLPHFVASIPPVADRLSKVLPGPADPRLFNDDLVAAIRGHDRVLLAWMQAREAYYHLSRSFHWYFFWLLGHFLLGYFMGKTRRLSDAPAHLPFFRKLFGWGIGLGLMGGAISAARHLLRDHGIELSPLVKTAILLPTEIGVLAMAAAYLSAIVLLMQRPAWRRRLMILAPVGQMPLTTYLTQSLASTFVFYGWGLGLLGKVGTARCIPLTLAIFAVQVLISHQWLRRYRFGPMEWVWRSLTYGRLPPMRRAELATGV
jgi:uncharacterized protein